VAGPQRRQHATIEMLLIGLDDPHGSSRLVDELTALDERQIVKVIDVIVVAKERDGAIHATGRSGLSEPEAEEMRRFVGDALGLQTGDHNFGSDVQWEGWTVLLGAADVKLIARQLFPGRGAVAVIFEHRWATRLGQLLHSAGVRLLEDDVLTPQLMSGAGMGSSIW
jgi:hypothetical protein